MEVLGHSLAILALTLGLLGALLPVLPGPPFAFLGVLLASWLTPFEYSGDFLLTWGLLAVVVTVLDYWLPIWSVKKGKGSKRATNGATIGVVVGLFAGPPGVILGPFVGALLGELSLGKSLNEAVRPAAFAFLGFLGGVFIKLVFALYLIGDYIARFF